MHIIYSQCSNHFSRPGSQVPFDDAGQEDKVFVLITPDGVVKYRLYIKLASTCLTNVKMFPFDHQICKLIFSSWTEGSSTISVRSGLLVIYCKDIQVTIIFINFGQRCSVKCMITPPSTAGSLPRYGGIQYKNAVISHIKFNSLLNFKLVLLGYIKRRGLQIS